MLNKIVNQIKNQIKNKRIFKIIILIIIAILIFCSIMKNFFLAEWSFITPHKQGDFVRVGNLNRPMYGHQMILLDDGRVFVYYCGYIEIYNPKTRRFSKINKTKLDKDYNSLAVKLKNGDVLILGGCTDNSTSSHTYMFDPKTNKITKGPDMITGRERFSAILLKDGSVFISGGEYHDEEKRRKKIKYESRLKTTEFYNPKTNKFEQGPELSELRQSHQTILTNDGKVLILSGLGKDIPNKQIDSCEHATYVELFNPYDNSIKLTGGIIYDRFAPDIKMLSSEEIFLVEGLSNSAIASARVIEKYDPKTNISTIVNKRTSSPEFVSTALLPDDTILFYGGSTGFSIGYTSHSNAQIYNPKTNKFTDVESKIPVNLYEGSSSVLLKDRNLLITGGGHDGLRYAVIYMTKNKIEK